MSIVDFKKQKFLRECKDYLKTGKISDSLSMAINNTTPGHLEFLKTNLTHDEKIVIDTVVKKIKQKFQKNITTQRQKVNMVAISVLENMSTLDKRFVIPKVIERYRDTINPVKALYYDLQEIMFLYNGKAKKEHHKFLIEKFSQPSSFEDILLAIDKDIEDLRKCKQQLKTISTTSSVPNSSEYAKRVFETYEQLIQWKKLFKRFPEWVSENQENDVSLLDTLKNFFTNE